MIQQKDVVVAVPVTEVASARAQEKAVRCNQKRTRKKHQKGAAVGGTKKGGKRVGLG